MSDIVPTFHGEMQLAGWAETHNGGCKVTFWLADASDLDAFRDLTVRKGNTAGHRFVAALVEIGDDEQPVAQPEPEKLKGGALATLAGRLCQDPNFHDFVAETYGVSWRIGHAADDIAQWTREQCAIDSRAELDHDEKAAAAFHRVIRGPWQKWCQRRGMA